MTIRGQAVYRQSDDSVPYTPSGSDVTAGDVIVLNSETVGVALRDIADGDLGSLQIEGIFEVVKVTGAISQGDAVFWNATGNPVTGTAGSGAAQTSASSAVFMGRAAADAASDDETVMVNVFSASSNASTIAGSVTANDITGSDSSLAVTGQGASTGGAVAIAGGAASGTNANGGAVTINGGAKNGAGLDGNVTIGSTNTGRVIIGAATIKTVLNGPVDEVAGVSTAAAGSTTSDAGVLPAATAPVYPTTAADDTKGVRVHANDKVTGRMLHIGNGVSNKILKVYPPSGGSINGGSTDAAFSSVSGKGVIMYCLDSTGNTWLAW